MQSLHTFDWSVRDIEFLLWQQFKLDALLNHETLQQAGIDRALIDTLLAQAKRFAAKELVPLNKVSDREGCHMDATGKIRLPTGYEQTWKQFCDSGWNELSKPVLEQITLPSTGTQAFLELFFGACPAFMMYSGFAAPIARLIDTFGNDWQKQTFAKPLQNLDWGGCFCMTEPEAGSDVGNIATKAYQQGDGTYLIEGEKIFITAGMHDLMDNLVYLVVARTPDAPAGTLGLSCFLVPRYALDSATENKKENGVRATRVENKMGLSGCATTALTFGFGGPCRGYLLGEQENKGLNQLASLMSLARMSTGLIALGIASNAYQNAVTYARQRHQGAHVRQAFNAKAPRLPIIEHADVKRNLLEMKARIEGCRALITMLSWHYTHNQYHEQGVFSLSQEQRAAHQNRITLMTPIVKAYISDQAWRVSELAIQVYGGHGYIRDNPVEQAARDCKILSIWEGTNYLQAADLLRDKCAMGRKAPALEQLIEEISLFLERSSSTASFPQQSAYLCRALEILRTCHQAIGEFTRERQIEHVFFSSTRFLKVMAEIIIAWLLLEGSVIAHEQLTLKTTVQNQEEEAFLQGRIASMRYFYAYILPLALTEAELIVSAEPLVEEVHACFF